MYHLEFIAWLKKHRKTSFTHKDIQRHTNANCTYSVVRTLKEYLEKLGIFLNEVVEKTTKYYTDPITHKKKQQTKKFKVYTLSREI